jgi:hypothetical protein
MQECAARAIMSSRQKEFLHFKQFFYILFCDHGTSLRNLYFFFSFSLSHCLAFIFGSESQRCRWLWVVYIQLFCRSFIRIYTKIGVMWIFPFLFINDNDDDGVRIDYTIAINKKNSFRGLFKSRSWPSHVDDITHSLSTYGSNNISILWHGTSNPLKILIYV